MNQMTKPANSETSQAQAKRRVVLITGLAGAGLSTALKALEDLGWEALDNLPLFLVRPLMDEVDLLAHPIAIAIDSRTRDFSPEALAAVQEELILREDVEPSLIFMDCADDVLVRRFTETRRRHPLALDRPVIDGIRLDRDILDRVRDRAGLMIDSSDLSIHDLRRIISGHFRLDADPGLHVQVLSFGFRNGVPREADMVFDVRFLANPHWDPELKPKTGLDSNVAAYVKRDPDFEGFITGVQSLIGPLLPRYRREGKSYLTLAIGCTGGRHRSVATAETMLDWLKSQGVRAGCTHRDLDRK